MASLNTSDINQLGISAPPVDFSSVLSLGSLFSKGASGASAIDRGVNAAGNAALAFATSNMGSSPTKYQKTLKTADSVFNAATTAIGFIPGVGTAASAILQGANWLGGKLAKNANSLDLSNKVGSSSGYTGTASDIGTQMGDINAYNKAGGFAKLFGNKSKLDSDTNQLKNFQTSIANIISESNRRKNSVGAGLQNIASQNELALNDIKGNELRIGKLGMKLSREDLTRIIKMKSGGKMNVIVNGKLHSEKHDINVDTDITEKGVPVIEMSEGGNLKDQAAEVERDEIILHLEITKKLEELKAKGDEEAMIEAGKLLSKEIIENTKDSKSKIIKNA